MAARAVLSGVAVGTPKNADGAAEMVRMLKIDKDSAVKARTQALDQIKAILVTAQVARDAVVHGVVRDKARGAATQRRPRGLSDGWLR